MVLVALYAGSKLVDLKILDSHFENAQSIDYTLELEFGTFGTENVVKVMAWDSFDSVRPACESKSQSID